MFGSVVIFGVWIRVMGIVKLRYGLTGLMISMTNERVNLVRLLNSVISCLPGASVNPIFRRPE